LELDARACDPHTVTNELPTASTATDRKTNQLVIIAGHLLVEEAERDNYVAAQRH
jgi:hypothetical protein